MVGSYGLDKVMPGLRNLMLKWQEISCWLGWRGTHDNPWWYGERASVSQLAGAAWIMGGWAMQDYLWRRGKGAGLVDLCVSHTTYRNRGLHFVAEGKAIYPELWHARPTTIETHVRGALDKAEKQLKRVAPDEYAHVSLVFVTPLLNQPKTLRKYVGNLIEAFELVDEACVWAFPTWAQKHKPYKGRYYPGGALIARYEP